MSKKAILCVDDEKTILDSLKAQLKRNFRRRYLYEFAESAEEAWEVIEELQEDDINLLIIISDWIMPGMKGDEFLIKVHQLFPRIMKVILTGQADQQAIERAKRLANLHSCLYKPWKEEELIQVMLSGLEPSLASLTPPAHPATLS